MATQSKVTNDLLVDLTNRMLAFFVEASQRSKGTNRWNMSDFWDIMGKTIYTGASLESKQSKGTSKAWFQAHEGAEVETLVLGAALDNYDLSTFRMTQCFAPGLRILEEVTPSKAVLNGSIADFDTHMYSDESNLIQIHVHPLGVTLSVYSAL